MICRFHDENRGEADDTLKHLNITWPMKYWKGELKYWKSELKYWKSELKYWKSELKYWKSEMLTDIPVKYPRLLQNIS